MSEKELRLKELQQLMDEAKTYEELKPIINELKKDKYRFYQSEGDLQSGA